MSDRWMGWEGKGREEPLRVCITLPPCALSWLSKRVISRYIWDLGQFRAIELVLGLGLALAQPQSGDGGVYLGFLALIYLSTATHTGCIAHPQRRTKGNSEPQKQRQKMDIPKIEYISILPTVSSCSFNHVYSHPDSPSLSLGAESWEGKGCSATGC